MDAAGAVFIRHWKNKRTCIEKENDVLDASIDEFTSATKNSMSALLYADKLSEEEFAARNINVVIYANQLTRSGFPAMQKVAKTILKTHRAKEADEMCMSIKEILTLIPEE